MREPVSNFETAITIGLILTAGIFVALAILL